MTLYVCIYFFRLNLCTFIVNCKCHDFGWKNFILLIYYIFCKFPCTFYILHILAWGSVVYCCNYYYLTVLLGS